MPQHGGRRLGLTHQAERQIGFGQAMQGLRHVAGGLVFFDDVAETADGRVLLPLPQVIAADFHLLASEMVIGQVDFKRRVARIGRIGEPPRHFAQRIQRLLGHPLVTPHIGDLLVIAKPLHVVGVGDVLAAGMELDEPIQGNDRIVVLQRLVMGECCHQLRPRRPLRIGVLPLDLVKQPGCRLVVFLIHGGGGLGIDRLDRALHIGGLLGGGTGSQRECEAGCCDQSEQGR
jgi:hypothetical protein